MAIGVIATLLLAAGTFFFMSRGNLEKEVLNRTYDLSKEYIFLRYRTDNILVQAKDYQDFKTWNADMSNLIEEWEDFENKVKDLEESANKLSKTKEISFNLIEKVYAYDKSEITRVFDKAPAGKKIATLAKHLGVDAKKAYAILKQDQDQVTDDAWSEAGDIFSKLETSATVIKDGCKVAGSLGNISDKVDAVLLSIEKFSETAQEGKILGIKLIPGKKIKVNTSLLMKYKKPVYVSELQSTEVWNWLGEQGIEYKNSTQEELEKISNIKTEKISSEKKEQNNNENKNTSVIGVWERIAKWTPGENEPESQETIIFEFLVSGKINILTNSGYDMEFNTWEQDGDVVRIYETEKELGYYEFKQEGDKMIFIKIAGPDEEDNWSEVYVGEDFFGGKYLTLTLHKQN